MKEQQFKKLLNKYVKGTLTAQEEVLLEKFNKELKSKNKGVGFKSEFERVEIQKSIWSEVQKTLNAKPKRAIWKSVASVAALFIGIIAIGYLYQNSTTSIALDLIPENAITLELEDGTIKVIEENGTTNIIYKNGSIIGQQKGSKLVYTEKGDNAVKELIYNTLTVPNGKKFEILLSDGTMVYLNSGSSLKYPIQFINETEREVSITGEAYLEVAKDITNPFIVNANNLKVRVLGTEFNVSAYPEDVTTEVVLVEGSVSLYEQTEKYSTSTILKPGFKGSINKNVNSIKTEKVKTSLYTSWMKDELVFRNISFSNIVKKLERHFNVEITNNNKALSHKLFNANFGNIPIEDVFEELKINYGIEYSYDSEARKIIIN